MFLKPFWSKILQRETTLKWRAIFMRNVPNQCSESKRYAASNVLIWFERFCGWMNVLLSKVLRGSINVATDTNLVSILWGMWILYWTDNKFISAVVIFNTIQPLKSSPYATYFPYGKLASMMIIFSVWKISEKLF